MSANLQINTRVRRLIHYIEDIEKGLVQIPYFQRDFIWRKENKLDLFDSIKRGYPIGSILFWKPGKSFGESEKVGPYFINTLPSNEYFYVLDGFQRLSTLFGCLINPEKAKLQYDRKEWEREYQIFYDLDKEEFFIPRTNPTEPFQIPVYTLIDTFEFLSFSQKLQNDINNGENFSLYLDRAKILATALVDYSLPSIDIIGGEIEEAVEIFSRINSKGATISSDWMVSALTSSKENNFRLGTLIDDLLIELDEYNFGGIKRDVIFQCIQNSFGKAYFDIKIKDLVKRGDFIEKTKSTINNIKRAVKFLFEELLVIESKVLPYNNQLIFITFFFNEVKNPTEWQLSQLKNWFWVTTYSSYFTIYSLSKQRMAYYQFKDFVYGKTHNPIYNDKPDVPFSVVEFPKNIYFGSVRAKALVLFLLNYSNDFKTVNSGEVDELKIYYLFKDYQDTSGVIPTIQYVGSKSSETLVQDKPKDLSFLLNENFLDKIGDKHFLTLEMLELFKSREITNLLNLRQYVIKISEKRFVESLGLKYES